MHSTRNASRRPYASEKLGSRYGMTAAEVAEYKHRTAIDHGRNHFQRNHFNAIALGPDSVHDFEKVLPHQS